MLSSVAERHEWDTPATRKRLVDRGGFAGQALSARASSPSHEQLQPADSVDDVNLTPAIHEKSEGGVVSIPGAV